MRKAEVEEVVMGLGLRFCYTKSFAKVGMLSEIGR